MTCYNFCMHIRTENVYIECKDGDMHMSTQIAIDDFADALLNTHANLDMLAKPIKDELKRRANNAWDMDDITDEELEHFKKVLGAIL